jgi:hypothetical protein
MYKTISRRLLDKFRDSALRVGNEHVTGKIALHTQYSSKI